MKYWTLTLTLLGLAACEPEKVLTRCETAVTVTDLQDGVVETAAESARTVTASVETCGAEGSYAYAWYADANHDSEFDDNELQRPLSRGAEWQMVYCANEDGDHAIRVVATPAVQLEDEDEQAEPLTLDFTVRVGSGTRAPRPACVASAVASIKNVNEVFSTAEAVVFDDAIECLDPYLQQNRCDFEASVASGLAHFGAFAAKVPDRFEARATLNEAFVETVLRTELDPMLERYRTVAQKAGDDFQFQVDGKFELQVFRKLPYLNGDQDVKLFLQGEHDQGDFHAFVALANAVRAGVELGLCYEGFYRFFFDIPQLDQVDFTLVRRMFVDRLGSDESFLTFEDQWAVDDIPYPDAPARLLGVRDRIVEAIDWTRQALDIIAHERDDQTTDILRYWDCGEDGLCNCNGGDTFLSCTNEPQDYPGPDDGEMDGKYQVNEPVGLDRIAFTSYFDLQIPSDINAFSEQIAQVQVNLTSGEAMDLDEVTKLPVSNGLEALLMPYPEIRLSQWFVTPTAPRELVPMYNVNQRDFIFDLEGEPYDDVGLDGIADKDEVIVHANNPAGLALGTAYHRVNNPDPHYDNMDPICNPVCTFTDGMDNDFDGVRDFADRARIDQYGFVFFLPQEIGVEGNLMFDFLDYNGDRVHDADEPAEPYEDIGVLNARGQTVGASDGRYSSADRGHQFPHGGAVGPVADADIYDPANGVDGDGGVRAAFGASAAYANYEGLVDPFYFFFMDPTFSGVLTFPEAIVGIEDKELTANGKLQRFLNKALELGNILEVAERIGDGVAIAPLNLGANRCADRAACEAALDVVK